MNDIAREQPGENRANGTRGLRLLDLFCGAGGASEGYRRAGFEVAGIDIAEQPNYPFDFWQRNALDYLDELLSTGEPASYFDAIHASPPCQGYSTQTADRSRHERLIVPVRERLEATGLPYVIENVEGAARELRSPVRLCGSSFGMDIRRHRYFEANWPLVGPPCNHGWQLPRFRSLDISAHRSGRLASVIGVHGHINYSGEAELRRRAMGIDWMTDAELVESIPPTFTTWIGNQLAAHLRATREASTLRREPEAAMSASGQSRCVDGTDT